MAKTPGEIQSNTEKRDKQLQLRVGILEMQIDMMLQDKSPRKGESVQFPLSMDEPEVVINMLIEIYQRAGWKVTRWQGHPRDACNNLCFVDE